MAMVAALRREGKLLSPLVSSTPITNNILRLSSFISPEQQASLVGGLRSISSLCNCAVRNRMKTMKNIQKITKAKTTVILCCMQCSRLGKFQPHLFTKLCKGAMIEKHNFLSTTSSNNSTEDGSEQKETISVTFVDKDGEEKLIKVPIGMSMLESAHENDIELEGACEASIACSTCHVIIMDLEYYNKLEDPTDEENDMLDLAFGLTETSRLGCQVIAKPELDGMRLAIPAATRNFAVDGYVPKPH